MRRRRVVLLFVALAACGAPRRDAPAAPHPRVVSAVVLADEVLWDLGPDVHRHVVGVSTMADDERYSGVVGRWPDSVARVAGGSEQLVALSPDLVITAEFTSMETLALLEQLRIPVLELHGFNRLESYAWHVRDIASALGVESRGDALIEAFDARRRALEAPATRLGDRPAIVSWQEGTVAGTGTTFAEQADAAGFRLLPAEHGITGHQSVALETLVAWDPRWIAIACTELDESACKATEREFAARPGIAATRAAREDGVIAVPSRILYSTGTGMLDVVEWLAARRRAGT